MERTDAVKWFWPFMLVGAVAGATIIALPPFQAKASADVPQFRMQMTVLGVREAHVADRNVVAMEPYRIQVTAKRAPEALGGMRNASLGASRADAGQAVDRANCAPL